MISFFNTLTRKVDPFIPNEPGKVKMYVCGPTVYDYIHIGNARPMIIFDCLRRYLTYRGFEVVYVQNFTDVDDKIINKAVSQGVSFESVVSTYIKEYETDARGLLVDAPTFAPRVSQNIDSIVEFIKKLIEKGHAYVSGGDVMFKTSSFKNYGKLSKMDLDSLVSGKRVELNDAKQEALDFVLWKAAKPNEPFWPSLWGNGRPGWHIECSVMASKYAAKTLDIHCGGQDLIFPHHENEIAQSECANGVKFSNYWLHNGFIRINDEKMSKSLGNFLTVRELATKFGYEVLRFLIVQAHYRSPLNFSLNLIEQCKSALDRLKNFLTSLRFAIKKSLPGQKSESLNEQLINFKTRFLCALDNDFNTADAIAVIFDIVRAMSDFVSLKVETSRQNLENILSVFCELIDVLKILDETNVEDVAIPADVLELFKQRDEARKLKDFKRADVLREKIEERGFRVEETRKGSRLIFKHEK